MSPNENRDIPPLDYDRVYRLKAALPDVPVIIKGGIGGLAEATDRRPTAAGLRVGTRAAGDFFNLLPCPPARSPPIK